MAKKAAATKRARAPRTATARLTEVQEKPARKLAVPRSVSRELYHRPEVTGWTPAKVESAIALADSGSYRRLADLCETMSADDRIKGVLGTRTDGLMGLPIDFVRGAEAARRVLGAQEDGSKGEWWFMHDEAELAKLLRWGLFLGVGLAQRIEQPRLLSKPHRYQLRTWSPRWLTYYYQPVSGAHWHVMTQEGLVPIVPGNGEWILFLPYGERRPHIEALWRSCAFPWLIKRFALEDRANYSEVLGSPIRSVTTGPGATEKQRAKMANQLRSLGKNPAIVLPNGWQLALIEAVGKSYEIYEGSVKWADEAMTISIAGQLVTTEGTTGFSDGNIHQAINNDKIRFDAERLATCMREQSVKPWALWNFGTEAAAPFPEWQTQRPTDQKDEADGLSKLGDAITKLDSALAPHGYKVDVAKLVDDFDIPITKVAANGP